jgi:hypothetical protein
LTPPKPFPRQRAAAAPQPGAAEGNSPKGVAAAITTRALSSLSANTPTEEKIVARAAVTATMGAAAPTTYVPSRPALQAAIGRTRKRTDGPLRIGASCWSV